MRKSLIILVILIIPLFIYLQFFNQQVQDEPADLDVQENLESTEDNNTTEPALEEDDEVIEDKTSDDNEAAETDEEDEIVENDEDELVENPEDSESNDYNSEEVDTGQENESDDNTEEASTEGAVNYTTESGIDIEGEIDFDMSLEEEISEEDKLKAIKYAAKLDIPYLLGLLKDGITNEDKVLVAEHLRERLTEEEYENTKELIVKYLFLLE